MTLQVLIGTIDVSGTGGPDAYNAYWSIDTFDGWGGTTTTLTPVQKPRASGAWAGTAYGTTRVLSLSGQVNAVDNNQDTLTTAIDRLIDACNLAGQTLTVIENSRTRYLTVRRSGEVMFKYTSATMAVWSVQLSALYPHKTGAALSQFTMLPSSTGGLQWPETWNEQWNSTTVSGIISLTNPGNVTGPVILRIDGPCTGPQIAHTSPTSVSAITFSSSLTLNTGEWLTINMDARQTLANDQSNRASYITSRGWFGFDPGVNVFSFSATTYNAASKLTVTATPTWK